MVFAPFQGDQPIDHILYIGSDPLLLMQRTGQLQLTFRLASAIDRPQIEPLLQSIQWEVFRMGNWVPLPSPTFAVIEENNAFTLTFPAFEGADVLALSGPGLDTPSPSRWIRGRLSQPITQVAFAEHLWLDALVPHTARQLDRQGDTRIPPDHVHVNAVAVDFTRSFLPLGENPKLGDTLSIASAEAFQKVEPSLQPEERGRVELAIAIDMGDATLKWEYFGIESGQLGKWIPLREGAGVFDETNALTRDGKIGLIPTSPPLQVRIPRPGGQTLDTVFLFRLSLGDGTYRQVPGLLALRVLFQTPNSAARLISPILAFTSERPLEVVDPRGQPVDLTGLTPVDLRTPFFPFGLNPTVGNTLYFGLPLEGQLDPGLPEPPVLMIPQTARLVWEFLGRDGWQRLGESSTREATLPPTEYELVDATRAFTRSGSVSFRRPPALIPGQVNGQTDYWVRARLVSGLYGRPLEFIPVDPADPSKGFKLRPGTGTLNAPVASAIRLGYEAQDPSPLVMTYNQFRLQDETATNHTPGEAYRPFEPVEESEPTFYLAFDQALPNDAVSLYFVVPPRQFVEKLT
jgi:hypothetical protein